MVWMDVCPIDDLQPDAGVCALVAGQQIALFYLPKEPAVYALHNYDPFGKANVLSRGVIGDLDGQMMVASPLYKHHFNLQTGVCLEDENVSIPAYPARINGDRVQIDMA
jgi:nitrite reductase (NADH) small subunit